MSLPIFQPGANEATAVNAFNSVLNAAYTRARQSGNIPDEPHFVRNLISNTTIGDLNGAASNIYDSNFNTIRFAAGFIHGTPLAKFIVQNGSRVKNCSRELADAVVVLNRTEPDASGIHRIVTRSACLLMFKTKDAVNPECPRYDCAGAQLPNGSDQEQFHLFGAWPQFDLDDGAGRPLGSFLIQQPSGSTHPHSHGKFAVLWSPTTKKQNAWQDKWRYADPVRSRKVKDSLGQLIGNMVNGDPRDGRDYALNGSGDWDKLIATLNGFTISHSWGGSFRSPSPAGLSFLQVQNIVDINLGTIAQHARDILTTHHFSNRRIVRAIEELYMLNGPYRHHDLSRNRDGTPILSITVSSFRQQERAESMNPERRALIMDNAIHGLFQGLRGNN